MFKVYYKNTRAYFTLFSSVSIVDFEITFWKLEKFWVSGAYVWNLSKNDASLHMPICNLNSQQEFWSKFSGQNDSYLVSQV